jgi:hypothetical protein
MAKRRSSFAPLRYINVPASLAHDFRYRGAIAARLPAGCNKVGKIEKKVPFGTTANRNL